MFALRDPLLLRHRHAAFLLFAQAILCDAVVRRRAQLPILGGMACFQGLPLPGMPSEIRRVFARLPGQASCW